MFNPNRTFLYSHNPHSNGGRELATALGIRRIRHGSTSFMGSPGKVVINWGSAGTLPFPVNGARVLNNPALVAPASNKLSFLQKLQAANVCIPEWTDNPHVARQWIDTGCLVVARTVLNGHSGAGIKILELGVDFVQAPLYTKYVKKEKEFRVHFAAGGCIDIQRKIKRPDFVGEPNWRVRNHQNGFIYVRNDIACPEEVKGQALQAYVASGLDFGAVDVLWNQAQGKAYVLEINTAPGLAGTTIQKYKQGILAACNSPVS